jgi:hypothetical protein
VSLGILVHGSNHFIVCGPEPTVDEARRLVRQWEFPDVDDLLSPPHPDQRWRISTKEFRENLQWAVSLRSDTAITPAVAQLLSELEARGIRVIEGRGLFV